MTITEISLTATTLASGIGWLLSHFRGKRAQDLADDSLAINSFEKLIMAQDKHIEALNSRLDATDKYFTAKCLEMQKELDFLKKKLAEQGI